MSQWSYIKRFGGITYKDFLFFGRQFLREMDASYKSNSKIKIILYKLLPYSITTELHGLNDAVGECNKKRQLAELDSFEDLTEELFDQAVNVRLVIKPENKEDAPMSAFGVLECKGRPSNQLVYYLQPEEIGSKVRICHLGELRPSRLKFKIGDGLKSCHNVSLF